MSTRTTHAVFVVLCTILGGCADCGKSDTTGTTGTQAAPVTAPSTNNPKFPQERHPLAPFLDAGTK